MLDRCLPIIRQRQRRWEDAAEALVAGGGGERDLETPKLCVSLESLASSVVQDWWALAEELVVRFGDGWEYDWESEGGVQPVEYPDTWLKQVRKRGHAMDVPLNIHVSHGQA